MVIDADEDKRRLESMSFQEDIKKGSELGVSEKENEKDTRSEVSEELKNKDKNEKEEEFVMGAMGVPDNKESTYESPSVSEIETYAKFQDEVTMKAQQTSKGKQFEGEYNKAMEGGIANLDSPKQIPTTPKNTPTTAKTVEPTGQSRLNIQVAHDKTYLESVGNEPSMIMNLRKNFERIKALKEVEAMKKHDIDKDKREIKPTDVKKSPFNKRMVEINTTVTTSELKLYNAILATMSSPNDIIFMVKNGIDTPLVVMQNMINDSDLHVGVIDVWSTILNYEEAKKSQATVKRLLCNTRVITKEIMESLEKAIKYCVFYKKFAEDMNEWLVKIGTTIQATDVVLFPIILTNHYYLVCFNLQTNKCYVVDNLAYRDDSLDRYNDVANLLKKLLVDYCVSLKHPKTKKMRFEKVERMRMPWRMTENTVDYGIFLMRHMKTFIGTSMSKWCCGFKKEGHSQKLQLNNLRCKYLHQMLYSAHNQMLWKVDSFIENYESLTEKMKLWLKLNSYALVQERLKDAA